MRAIVLLLFLCFGGLAATPSKVPATPACPTLLQALVHDLPRYASETHDLRELTGADFARLKHFFQDPESLRMSGEDHMDDGMIRWMLNHAARPSTPAQSWQMIVLGIRDQKTGELVGAVQFHAHSPDGSAELGFVLAREHWGKGITSQMVKQFADFGFKELGLKRIIAKTLVTNAAANGVLGKVGFEKKRDETFEGKRINVYTVTPEQLAKPKPTP